MKNLGMNYKLIFIVGLFCIPFLLLAGLDQPSNDTGNREVASNKEQKMDAATASRPNIIFILADDMGWGDLACFGNEIVRTPNLNRLANEGTRYTQFYVASAVCSPTRTAAMTGVAPSRLAIHRWIGIEERNQEAGMPNWLDPSVPTITSMLQSDGYATGHFGKWHMGYCCNAPDPGAYGIDDHVTTNSTGPNFPQVNEPYFRAESTRYIVDEVIEFIEANHETQPFYINMWTLLPHDPLDPTPDQLEVYDHLRNDNVPYIGAMQIYYASITAMDEQIGRLLVKLDELDIADNTLVVFASDNGPEHTYYKNSSHSAAGSSGPFRGGKRSLYEGGIRMPLIVRWPDMVAAGAVDNDSVITTVDLMPTFARVAGAALPNRNFGMPKLDGEDVTSMLVGFPQQRRTPIFWEWRFGRGKNPIHWLAPMLAIRSGNWKLLLNPDWSRVELYDVVADPKESDNLANEYPDVVNILSTEALVWQASLPPGPYANDAGSDEYNWPQE